MPRPILLLINVRKVSVALFLAVTLTIAFSNVTQLKAVIDLSPNSTQPPKDIIASVDTSTLTPISVSVTSAYKEILTELTQPPEQEAFLNACRLVGFHDLNNDGVTEMVLLRPYRTSGFAEAELLVYGYEVAPTKLLSITIDIVGQSSLEFSVIHTSDGSLWVKSNRADGYIDEYYTEYVLLNGVYASNNVYNCVYGIDYETETEIRSASHNDNPISTAEYDGMVANLLSQTAVQLISNPIEDFDYTSQKFILTPGVGLTYSEAINQLNVNIESGVPNDNSGEEATDESTMIYYQFSEILPPLYDEIENFSDGLAAVRLGTKWGYIDEDGNEVIPLIYDRAYSFSEGLARVEIDYKPYVIDKTGNQVFYFNNLYVVSSFSEGLAAFTTSHYPSKFGYIDTYGNEVIPCIYDGAGAFSNGIAVVNVIAGDGLSFSQSIIDKNGIMAFPLKENMYIGDFIDGLARVTSNKGKHGFINKNGEEIVPPIYDYASSFNGGFATVQLDDKYGIINSNGEIVVPIIYDSIPFGIHDGLAAAELNGKSGYIDKDGNVVIPFVYDVVQNYHFISNFSYGFAAVRIKGKWGFIDKTGKEVTSFIYDDVLSNFEKNSGLAMVGIAGSYGFIDKSGKEIIPLKYARTSSTFNDGLAGVASMGKYGFIDMEGRELTGFKWDTFSQSTGADGIISVAIDSSNGREWGLLKYEVSTSPFSSSFLDSAAQSSLSESTALLLDKIYRNDFSGVAGIYNSPRWGQATIGNDGSVIFDNYMDFEGYSYKNVPFTRLHEAFSVPGTDIIAWNIEYRLNFDPKFDIYDTTQRRSLHNVQEVIYIFPENVEARWTEYDPGTRKDEEYGIDSDTARIRFYVEMVDLFDGGNFNEKGNKVRNEANEYFTKQ
ncbi:MAG: WG repeat-containing protein [Clostridiales bacterium]|jgi:hypothetical protein|nr:WG repeat-containing protein [Clostridiales bacterium]